MLLIPSKVDKDYNQVTERNIPFTYHARGGNNLLDNLNVPLRREFPDSETDDGLKGFIRQFSTTFTSDTVEIEFSLEFEIARILP